MLEHVDWIDPDDIVLSNSTNDPLYKKMTGDVQINGVKEIRLLTKRITPTWPVVPAHRVVTKSYFRYVVNGEICWFYVGNPGPRKGVYYTAIHLIWQEEYDELNNLFKVLNRDDKLKELGI
jgi:hypothetical protein